MGSLRGPEFYNVDGGDGTDHFKPTERSPWLPLYEYAARLIDPEWSVVDLGCGAGRFAKKLQRQRHLDYLGIDFCEDRIEIARAYVPGSSEYIDQDFAFKCQDIMTYPIPDADCYVTLEILEHIEDDVGLLKRLPEGSLIVLSVPPTDAASHVRVFPDWDSVFNRYQEVLDYKTADFAKGIAMGKFVVRCRVRE